MKAAGPNDVKKVGGGKYKERGAVGKKALEVLDLGKKIGLRHNMIGAVINFIDIVQKDVQHVSKQIEERSAP